jgi:hypothetical protein
MDGRGRPGNRLALFILEEHEPETTMSTKRGTKRGDAEVAEVNTEAGAVEAVEAAASKPTEVVDPPEGPRFITPTMACSRSYFGADPEA